MRVEGYQQPEKTVLLLVTQSSVRFTQTSYQPAKNVIVYTVRSAITATAELLVTLPTDLSRCTAISFKNVLINLVLRSKSWSWHCMLLAIAMSTVPFYFV